MTTYTIHPIHTPGDQPVSWAIFPVDGETGYIVGDAAEVDGLLAALYAWRAGAHGQPVDHQDSRLGYRWLTTGEAQALAIELTGEEIPHSTLTYACREGLIEKAQRAGRDWVFSQNRFLYWLHNRPKPGRKPQ